MLALSFALSAASPALSIGTRPASEQMFLPSAPAFDVRNGGRVKPQQKIAILHRRGIVRSGHSLGARETAAKIWRAPLLPAAVMLALAYAAVVRRRVRAA